ncbi:acyl-CoA transferase [Mesorhizobium sp. Root552]|uniref:CaiB/BaiF CoA transferase family protein n=1 Tax=Mesorhizobium sp. Root552 TaxID=1736555 RepID=UPI0006FC9299|nr:CoA transferase [Mesorhizobium sp. Root552]KQZ26554.1 acyl-CoA transferase [Mesorhizobium sp. Root552]
MTEPSSQKAATRPLAGMRVLDFSRVLAGPYCTALLADLGADVIKVEPPAGDDYRHVGPFIEGESALFLAVNRGKRSISLDLTKPGDLAIGQALAARSDVVVENFRPGVADKLGIGWGKLSGINPKLVYASISGFGQKGELAARPAYDIVLQAMSGIMSVTGTPDGPPTLVGESIADVVAGLFGSWSILAALVERQTTGIGRHIDLAMFDAMIAIQPLVVARYLASGQAPQRVGNRHALSAPFGAFQARDGMFVLAVLNNKLFGILANLIGRPELAADHRFGSDTDRLANEQALREAIEGWSRQLTAEGAVSALVAAGVPAAEISDMAEALKSPHAEARGLLQETEHPLLGAVRVPEQPARFSGVVRGGIAAAPALDADRQTILAELGEET